MKEAFDFYSKTNLKSYNLDESMRYQLNRLDSLDVFTRKHCENVANLTCRLCEYLRLNKDFIVYCTVCAYLHDIGKLFIPSSILQKNGPLTDEEYEVMKTHTSIGYKMCMEDKKLQPYVAGPIYHHEALNGSGYPKGLTKKQIPLEGQIIRVADEFDAIVSKRQYKSHVGISDTLKIIIDNSNPAEEASKPYAVSSLIQDAKIGKVNKAVVKALLKVVIDDTEYEISCVSEYLDYLKEQLKRLDKANEYYNKMVAAKKEHDRNYNLAGVEMMLIEGETLDNFSQIQKEYEEAYVLRKEKMEKLYKEVKKIKKMKV